MSSLEDEWAEAGAAPPRRRWPWILLGVVLAVLLAVVALVAWIATTPSGTTFAVSQVRDRVAGLSIGGVQGTIARGLTVHAIRYVPPDGGTSVRLRRATARVAWRDLPTLHLVEVTLLDATILLGESPPKDEKKPFSLRPPLDVVVDRFAATNVVVERDDAALATVREARARGRWTGDGLAIEQLDVRADEGAVQLRGRVAGGPVYAADADARFRWRLGTTTWSGTTKIASDGPRVHADVALTAPFAATLDGDVRQQQDWPWRVAVRVPAFDPREALQPDGAMRSVSANLAADGTRERVAARGRVTVDGQPVDVEALDAHRGGDGIVVLDRLVVRPFESPGRLQASGTLDPSAQPIRGRVRVEWRDLVVPAEIAGQRLRSRGRLDAAGDPRAWHVAGTLSVGPGARLADLDFRAHGTGERIDLERFDVVQASGRLAARGVLRLAPARGWALSAEATSFDPGEFAAAWRGDLNFALQTDGVLADDGPRGRLALRRLDGRLRGRPLEGRADLEFAPPLRLAGDARLRSGASRIAITGTRGDVLDARATFAVASLDDFLPGAAGAFDGEARARGAWPDVTIDATARGRGLRAAGASVGSVDVRARVRNPRAPSGTVRLDARRVAAAGLEFATVALEAGGDAAAHHARLDAAGDRLSVGVDVRGALDRPSPASRERAPAPSTAPTFAWRGAVERLDLRAPRVAHYALEAPAHISYVGGAIRLQRSCLVDGDARVCAAAETRPDGAMSLEYAVARLPLGLANAVLAGRLPGELRGELGGDGALRRDSAGRWTGRAALASPEASIAWSDDAPSVVAGETLVLYRGLDASVTLRGTAADVRVRGAIAGDGLLDAQAAFAELDAPTPRVRGTVRADLPSLAPFAPFVPQVDALAGRVTAQGTVDGTLAAPRIAGQLRGSGLAGEVPLVGLKLTDGQLAVDARPEGPIRLAASVKSGTGTLDLRGTATPQGVVEATIAGESVLAADIPAARVVASPELRLTRDAERIALTGRVTIPVATINVQRLPQAGPQKRSPDVVVVNEPAPREDAASALPLYARIEVVLGDKVELAGFGLQSTLGGALTVTERPGRRTIGSGEIRVAGQYKAYGQDLKITSGRLLFAGTPLDNPRLEIDAVRDLKDSNLQAGLRIRGTARNPEVSVFSDPSLGETDALAYLVTGKPMNAIGRGTGEEGDLVQKAAQSLGTAAGGLLAKRFGKRLGVDEVGITDSEDIGGAAFTVGQYLSPRLYLGYGIGLFDPGQVITLRYALSQGLSVEVVRGDETMRSGVEYRVER